jgi:dsDNA-specific endonuclease/ATPase MutS2
MGNLAIDVARSIAHTIRLVSEDELVEIPITDTLDLHPFRPREIRDVAREYLIEARAAGFTQVRLIHGRGIGAQRENIRALLRSLDFVVDFQDADASGGGWGSTVVLLAPNSLIRE